MSTLEACAWCGATDHLMIRPKHGTLVMACVDWIACGEREKKKNAVPQPSNEPFGRKTQTSPRVHQW